MHLFRAWEPLCLLLALVITGPCIEFYEQKCHEAFSHADVAPAALEWSIRPPLIPFPPPLRQRAPATCHLPPCLPHVMICCSHPVLEGASRLGPRSHDAPFLQGFSFAPTRGAWPIAISDPRICPGRTSEARRSSSGSSPRPVTRIVAMEKNEQGQQSRRRGRRKRPQVGHTCSYHATAVAVAAATAPSSPVEALSVSAYAQSGTV